jgi:hypothetical protein
MVRLRLVSTVPAAGQESTPSEPGALQHEQQDQRPDDRQDDACGVHYRTVAGSGAKRSRLEADVAAVIEEVQLQCFKAKTKKPHPQPIQRPSLTV